MEKEERKAINRRMVISRFAVMIVMVLVFLFLPAGTLEWCEGWGYAVLSTGMLVLTRIILLNKNPDTALERLQAGSAENVKQWDIPLVRLLALYLPMLLLLTAGLDKRFGWTIGVPKFIKWTGFVVYLISAAFASWALLENKFFSSHVRIQTDLGHTVISTGPYNVVRHPGYAGGIISWLATPLMFGSWPAAVIAVLIAAGLIYRTAREDRTLRDELSGYEEYVQKVRWRLFPGLW